VTVQPGNTGRGAAQGQGPPVLFQATITGEPSAFRSCDRLDLDILPVRGAVGDGRYAVEALVTLDELVPLVAAGATVELKRLVDRQLPQDRISSPEQARARMQSLQQYRRQAGG
jgi:hypothetical protein